MIRLNEIQESKIINNGKAGLVKGLSLTLESKTSEHNENFPDFKFIFSESNGARIDVSFYYFTNKEFETQNDKNKRMNVYLRRLMHIVKAVMGQDYSPTDEFANMKDAADFCVKVIKDNCSDKLFDLFINFGTTRYPSKRGFLEVRFNTPFVRNEDQSHIVSLVPIEDEIIDKSDLILLQNKNLRSEAEGLITRDSD